MKDSRKELRYSQWQSRLVTQCRSAINTMQHLISNPVQTKQPVEPMARKKQTKENPYFELPGSIKPDLIAAILFIILSIPYSVFTFCFSTSPSSTSTLFRRSSSSLFWSDST